jgi:energy-coupling factor transporter ATP-binding protein EcfA2
MKHGLLGDPTMKIVALQGENYKGLKAIEIVPTGNLVELTGKNGQGKSSILDLICMLLGGEKGEPDMPIRAGETSAKAVLKTTECTIEWKRTLKRSYLEITLAGQDKPIDSPKRWLQERIGGTDWDDPTRWLKLKPREQRQYLLGSVPGADLSRFDNEVESLKAKRSDATKEKDQLSLKLESMPSFPSAPKEEVKAVDLLGQLEAIQQHNKDAEGIDKFLEQQRQQIESQRAKIATSNEQIRKIQAIISEAEKVCEQIRDSIAHTVRKEPISPEPIRQQIAQVDAINAQVRANQERAKVVADAEKYGEKASDLLSKMRRTEEDKARAMAGIAWPVAGLAVNEDGVLFEGIPLAQVNTAKQQEISLALWMAKHPGLKDVFMDANVLDSESFGRFQAMTEAQDIRVWVEKTTEGDQPIGFVIEAGEIVAKNGAWVKDRNAETVAAESVGETILPKKIWPAEGPTTTSPKPTPGPETNEKTFICLSCKNRGRKSIFRESELLLGKCPGCGSDKEIIDNVE